MPLRGIDRNPGFTPTTVCKGRRLATPDRRCLAATKRGARTASLPGRDRNVRFALTIVMRQAGEMLQRRDAEEEQGTR